MTSVELGLPTLPRSPIPGRRICHQVMVGDVPLGGDAPVSVQSMTTTRTCDIDGSRQ